MQPNEFDNVLSTSPVGAGKPMRMNPKSQALVIRILDEIRGNGALDEPFDGAEVTLTPADGVGALRLRCGELLGEGGRGVVFECELVSAEGVAIKPEGPLALKVALTDHDNSVSAESELHSAVSSELLRSADPKDKDVLPRFWCGGTALVDGGSASRQAILMSRAPGKPLHHLINLTQAEIDQGAPRNMARALRIAAGVLDGAVRIDRARAKLHRGRSRHGDIKESNVIANGFEEGTEPTVTVIDLGALCDVQDDPPEGTPGFERDDMKATGAILSRMIARYCAPNLSGNSEDVRNAVEAAGRHSEDVRKAVELAGRLSANIGFKSAEQAVLELREAASRIDRPWVAWLRQHPYRVTGLLGAIMTLCSVVAWGSNQVQDAKAVVQELEKSVLVITDEKCPDSLRRLEAQKVLDQSGLLTGTEWPLGFVWPSDLGDWLGLPSQDEISIHHSLARLHLASANLGVPIATPEEANTAWEEAAKRLNDTPGSHRSSDDRIRRIHKDLEDDCELAKAMAEYCIGVAVPRAQLSPFGGNAVPAMQRFADGAHADTGSARYRRVQEFADALLGWCVDRTARSEAPDGGCFEELNRAIAGPAGKSFLANRLDRLHAVAKWCDALTHAKKLNTKLDKEVESWDPSKELPSTTTLERGLSSPPEQLDDEESIKPLRRLYATLRSNCDTLCERSEALRALKGAGPAIHLSVLRKAAPFNGFAKGELESTEKAIAQYIDATRTWMTDARSDLATQCDPGKDPMLLIPPAQDRMSRRLEEFSQLAADVSAEPGVADVASEARRLRARLLRAIDQCRTLVDAESEIAATEAQLKGWTPKDGTPPHKPQVALPEAQLGETSLVVSGLQVVARRQATLRDKLDQLQLALTAVASDKYQYWQTCRPFCEYARDEVERIEELARAHSAEVNTRVNGACALMASDLSPERLTTLSDDIAKCKSALRDLPRLDDECDAASFQTTSRDRKVTAETLAVLARVEAYAATVAHLDNGVAFGSLGILDLAGWDADGNLAKSLHSRVVAVVKQRIDGSPPGTLSALNERAKDLDVLSNWGDNDLTVWAKTKMDAVKVCLNAWQELEKTDKACRVEVGPAGEKLSDCVAPLRTAKEAVDTARKRSNNQAATDLLETAWIKTRDDILRRFYDRFDGQSPESLERLEGRVGSNPEEWESALRKAADDLDSAEIWEDDRAQRDRLVERLRKAAETAATVHFDSVWQDLREEWGSWCRSGARSPRLSLTAFRDLARDYVTRSPEFQSAPRIDAAKRALRIMEKLDVRLQSPVDKDSSLLIDEPKVKFADGTFGRKVFSIGTMNTWKVGDLIAIMSAEDHAASVTIGIEWESGELDEWIDEDLTDFNGSKGAILTRTLVGEIVPGKSYPTALGCGDPVGPISLAFVLRPHVDSGAGADASPGTVFERVAQQEAAAGQK